MTNSQGPFISTVETWIWLNTSFAFDGFVNPVPFGFRIQIRAAHYSHPPHVVEIALFDAATIEGEALVFSMGERAILINNLADQLLDSGFTAADLVSLARASTTRLSRHAH